ncbi:MAG: hypothetical protein GTO40_13980 [Deltaproteobacteria bacterium]|nr:hypothetical protein [Deltaproteobacteria bacterium]
MRLGTLAVAILTLGLILPLGNSAFAGNDPTIKGQLRADIQKAMQGYVAQRTVDGAFLLYDPVTDEVLRLTSAGIHKGIVKEGDFYVSCAGFKDQHGRDIDVDIMVIADDDNLRASQAFVHTVGGVKRVYNLWTKWPPVPD